MRADYKDWSATRTILLEDVAAVFIPRNPRKPERSIDEPKRWKFGEAVGEFLELKQKNPPTPNSRSGFLYVHEKAPVFMNVEFVVHATDSAEYFPEFVYTSGCWAPTEAGPCRDIGRLTTGEC
jgi:hypothetical protein